MLAKLFLTPVDVNVHIPKEDLLGALRDMQLVSAELPLHEGTHFSVGERFLELIIFLGCSPSIALSADEVATRVTTAEGEGFCHVGLKFFDQPCLVLSPDQPTGRCRHCRADIPFILDDRSNSRLTCAKCNCVMSLSELDFRKMGAVGRCFVEVWGIHPHEAVPADELLDRLASLGPSPWQYFYSYGKERLVEIGGVRR